MVWEQSVSNTPFEALIVLDLLVKMLIVSCSFFFFEACSLLLVLWVSVMVSFF